jgi:O-antigen ligase
LAQVAVAGGGVALLSFADGGFFERAWPPATIAFVAVAALAVVLSPGVEAFRTFALLAAGLTAFAAWQALSAVWSLEPASSLREAERGLLYVAAAVALGAVVRRSGGRWLLTGVLAGGTGVAAYSLGDRVLEGPAYDPTQFYLLIAPIGYANALGIVAAVVLVIGLGLAVTARSPLELIPPAAAVAVAGAALALTSSRGSWTAAAIGAATVAVFLWTSSARVRTAWLALQAVVVAAVLVSPLAINLTTLERVLSERPYYWWTAWHAVGDRPVLGSGAGTFDLVWAAGAPVPSFVLDAHSLYLETLVELGPLGLGLLLVALLAPVGAAIRMRTPVGAAAAGAYVAFLFHAGVDWDWEMPAVTVAGLACGVALMAERKFSAAATSPEGPDDQGGL